MLKKSNKIKQAKIHKPISITSGKTPGGNSL